MAEIDLPGPELVDGIQKQFDGDTRPATVAMVAHAYGTVALAVDLMVSLIALTAKSNPQVVLTPEWQTVAQAVTALSTNLASNLTALPGAEDHDGE